MSEKQKYRVAGASRVFGVEPGKTFERAIPAVQEAQLLQGGAIKRVGGATKKKDGRKARSSSKKRSSNR